MVRQGTSGNMISTPLYRPQTSLSMNPAPLQDLTNVQSFISEKFKNGNHELSKNQPQLNGISGPAHYVDYGESIQNVKSRLSKHIGHKSKI